MGRAWEERGKSVGRAWEERANDTWRADRTKLGEAGHGEYSGGEHLHVTDDGQRAQRYGQLARQLVARNHKALE